MVSNLAGISTFRVVAGSTRTCLQIVSNFAGTVDVVTSHGPQTPRSIVAYSAGQTTFRTSASATSRCTQTFFVLAGIVTVSVVASLSITCLQTVTNLAGTSHRQNESPQ